MFQGTIVKPPIIFVLILIGGSILAVYNCYRSWFKIDIVREEIRKAQSRMPSWYPFRNYYLRQIDQNGWVTEMRLLNTLGAIITIGVTIAVIVAFFIGK